MSKIQLILGRTGTGKSHRILTEITNNCTANPLGSPIFVITPEQMTFHTEYQLLLMNPANSLIRANVTSFTRLAQRIMQEVGGLARYHLDEVGKTMLLQKIMLSQTNDELGIFAKYVKKPGFIQKMNELFSEFKKYQLNPANLKEQLTKTDLSRQTQQKIATLVNIYELFNETTLTQYLTTEDYFTLLIDIIAESELITQAEIYIDGYHTFNVVERAIIGQLAQHAKKLTIALTIDETSNYGLFNTTQTTFANLMADLEHLKPHIVRLPKSGFPAPNNPTIRHIETNFMQAGQPQDVWDSIDENIQLLAAPSRRLEIEAVATRIHELAYQQNVAFSNIAIYSSNPQADQHLFQNIFTKYDIPYFLDYKSQMLTHPVINLLYQVFDVFESNWRSSSVLKILKTGLFVDVLNFAKEADYKQAVIKNLETVDRLENYVIARNIRKQDWFVGQMDGAEMVRPLIEFELVLEQAHTVIDFATAVFTFLEQLEIPKKLQLMTAVADRQGEIHAKKQHEQVWSKLLQILEQIVEVAGGDPLSRTDFVQILRAGLEQLTFATIPPALDAVQIGDIIRSRYQLVPNFQALNTYGIEHLFIIGANDGELPLIPVETSLLSEKERQILNHHKIELAPSLMQSQQDEIFSLYTILSAATKTITISYSTENSGQPSYIFTHLANLFPQVEIIEFKSTDPYARLTTKRVLFDKTLLNLRLNREQRCFYQPVIDYLKWSDQLQYQLLERALGYANQVQPLSPTQASNLYGTEIEASVSRLELFNNCQFAHFMSYGLKLRERDLFQLEISDIGTLFHEVLKSVSRQLQKENRGFATLTDSEIQTLAKMGVDAVLKKEKAFLILKSSPRMNQLAIKLQAVVTKTIFALAKQGNLSNFKESYFEMRFGKDANIKTKPRTIGDVELSLKGVIDRIDLSEADGKKYLRVVDYKSSKRELELDSVYYGLSLQLLTYLDVAITGLADDFDNAGALYFHVHNPYTQVNEELLTKPDFGATLMTGQSAQYRMTGLLPANYDVVTMSDLLLADGTATKSDVIPVTLKKDGTFAAVGNRTLQTVDFDLLRNYTNQKIDESVGLMVDGAVQINPASHKTKTACDWCKFKAVCQFDLAHNKHRNLPKLKNEEVLTRISK